MSDELEYAHRMNGSDALMWSIEKDPILRSTITAVALLDQAPDRPTLRARIERGTRIVPRMRQRVVSSPLSVAPPRWAVDRNFDLDYHLRFTRCPGAGTLRDLLDVAEPIAMQGFDRARPLWEFTVVDGLEGDAAAVVMKLHHSITDGVGGIQIAMHLVDLDRQPGEVADGPPAPEPDDWTFPRRMADAAAHETRRQVARLRSTLAAAPRALRDPRGVTADARATASSLARLLRPATEPLSPIMRERSLSVAFDSISVPLEDLKAAARLAGGKLNDAFLAAVAGGMDRYHRKMGQAAAALRMNMPINVRDGDTQHRAGNQFVPARFAVPIDIADPAERIRTLRALVAEQRAEPALRFTDLIADLVNRLPTSVVTEVLGSMLKGVDFTTSNVPGVPLPVYLAGARLDALIPFGPLAGTAANLTLVSHLDQVHVGINMDPAAVTEPDTFVASMQAGFDEVLALA